MLHDILSSSAVATKRALAHRAKAEAAEAARKEGTVPLLRLCFLPLLVPLVCTYFLLFDGLIVSFLTSPRF